MKHTKAYDNNKAAKVGETINCLVCNKTFIKKQYSQVFCCGECKDKFWNRRGDRHKSGYYKKYDEQHPERVERAVLWGYKKGGPLNADDIAEMEAMREYRTNEKFRDYVNDDFSFGDDPGCNVTLATQLENFYGID